MAKRVELLYFDTTLGQWANARYRYWKTALDPDDWASVSATQGTDINPITAVHIVDTIGNPRKAQVTIVNRPRQMGSSTANERKGRFTGVFTDFQSVRLRDPETGTILLAGKIYNADEKFDFQFGTSIVLDIRDAVQELIDTRTAHWPDKEQTGNSTTRSGLITDIIAGNRDYTFSSLIATDGQNKVGTSARTIESTGVREFKGNKSALAEIAQIAAEDPHSKENQESIYIAQLAEALDTTETGIDIDEFQFGYANAGQAFAAADTLLVNSEIMRVVSIASDTLTVVRGVLGTTAGAHGENDFVYKNPGASKFGFDYHVDPAVETTSVSVTPANAPADWNYYRRGTRPDSPKKFGMTIKYPAASSFTPNGFNKMMQNDFAFSNPKEELYTDVILEYTEKGPEVLGDGSVNKKESGGASITKRRKFERLDITGASGRLSVEGMIKACRLKGAINDSVVECEIDQYSEGEANVKAVYPADVFNSGDYIQMDNEIMRIDEAPDSSGTVDDNESIHFVREQLGTTAAAHSDNVFIYRNPHATPDAHGSVPFGQTEVVQSNTGSFGHIEYQSHSLGSGLENNDPPGFIIVSPFNNPLDTEHVLFNQHMPESSVTVTGTVTGNTVTTMATCRYAKNIGMRKTKVLKNTSSSDPADLRKSIIGFLSRNTQTSVKRGEFKVTGYPYVYLELPAAKVATSGSNTVTFASDAFTNNAGATSQDPRDFGVLTGDVICEMDSTGTTITRYAYISSVTATTVVFGGATTDTSDGTILDQNMPMRIYVPLRAGHVIRVENTLSDVDADHLVTELVYDEGSGVTFTSLSTTGQYDTAVSFKPNILKAINSNDVKYGKEPGESVFDWAEPGDWSWTGQFKGTAYNAISWGAQQDGAAPSGVSTLTKNDGSAPPLEIAAGSSTGLTAETNYVAYIAPVGVTASSHTILVTPATSFKANNKKYFKIADIRSEENDASMKAAATNASNITAIGGRNVGLAARPEDLLTPGTITNEDGTQALPSITFSGSDGHTGIFLYESGASEYVGITADEVISAYFGENGAGIWFYEHLNAVNDNTQTCGTASYRWNTVYAGNATINTSDARLKENVETSNLGLDFVNDLNPVSYNWKDKDGPDINRSKHYGVVAQDVVEVLKNHGVSSLDEFGGIVYDKESDHYGAAYTEFVPILIKAVQELSDEVKRLKEKN